MGPVSPEQLRRKSAALGGATAALAGTPALTFMKGHPVAGFLCLGLELTLAILAITTFVRYRQALAAGPRR